MKKQKARPKTKSISHKVTLVILAFFIVSFFVGLMHGTSIKKQPDYLRPFTRNNITGPGGDDNEGYFLEYRCKTTHIRYYIDANRVEDLSSSDLPKGSEAPSVLTPLLGDETLLKVLLGGATSYTFKDALDFITNRKGAANLKLGKRIQLVALAVVATVTGYALGYWVAMKNPPECDAPQMLALLKEPSEWKPIERVIWNLYRQKVGEGLSAYSSLQLSDPEKQKLQYAMLNQAITKMDQLTKRAADTQHDFFTQDFTGLEEVLRLRDAIQKNYRQQSLGQQ